MEDANSDYQILVSFNGPMNIISCFIRNGPDAEGIFANGTKGVMCWDTAFAIQAAHAAGLVDDEKWKPMLTKALECLDNQQIQEDCELPLMCHRSRRKGG
ncbi:hypothetical protein BDW69DRAFT_182566 [Aspergillus filifer]